MSTSSSTHQNAIQLDKFHATAQLPRPICLTVPIQSEQNQNVCVTIAMNNRGNAFYWFGAGCGRQECFQHTAGKNVPNLTRNVQLDMTQEHQYCYTYVYALSTDVIQRQEPL